MKHRLLITMIPFLFACTASTDETETGLNESTAADSLEMNDTQQMATNQTDAFGLKQGYWIYYGRDFPERGYHNAAKIEEGNYHNDLKSEAWIYYSSDNKIDSVVMYEKGRTDNIHSNQKDRDGLMQGHWVHYGKHWPERGYPEDSKIEEGWFKDSEKVGFWTFYNPTGEIDSVVRYQNGVGERVD